MKFLISHFGIVFFLTLFLMCSCKKSPTGVIEDQGNEKPEILYVARKHVHEGRGDAVSINIMDARGKNHKEIISVSDGYVKDPYFSSDGEVIVFIMHSDTFGIGENLYTMNYDGTNVSRITLTDTTITYFVPQFTSDASKVIYLARINNQEIQIRILDLASKQQTVLVPQTNDGRRPAISQDGEFLFYNSIDGDVHRIVLDGTSDERLTNYNYTSQIQLSGDGKIVYFVSKIEDQLFDLFSMTLNGEDIRRVTNLDNLSNAYFRISLDGKKIINLTSSPSGNSFDIINSNGSEKKTIQISKTCWDTFEFFPDGEYIIFQVDGDVSHNNDDHLYRIDATGTNMQILTLDEYHDNQFCDFRP